MADTEKYSPLDLEQIKREVGERQSYLREHGGWYGKYSLSELTSFALALYQYAHCDVHTVTALTTRAEEAEANIERLKENLKLFVSANMAWMEFVVKFIPWLEYKFGWDGMLPDGFDPYMDSGLNMVAAVEQANTILAELDGEEKRE